MSGQSNFWCCVDRSGGEGGCWSWRGATFNGRPRTGDARGSRNPLRRAYDLLIGDPPDGFGVAAGCGNIMCCNPGHARLVRARGPGNAQPFWSCVDKSAGESACWPWTIGRDDHGYGVTRRTSDPSRKAHREAWRRTFGDVPEGMQVLHRCDNPPCCNPAHLFLGTNADNVADKMAKGRHGYAGCPGGENHWTKRLPDHIPRGSARGHSKVTEDDVREIRQAVAKGPRGTATRMAEKFGISTGVISQIVARTKWTHVK